MNKTNKQRKRPSAYELLYAIGMCDDAYLLECEKSHTIPFYKRKSFTAAVSAAACFALIVTGTVLVSRLGSHDMKQETALSTAGDISGDEVLPETHSETTGDNAENKAVAETGTEYTDEYSGTEAEETEAVCEDAPASPEAVPEMPEEETLAVIPESATLPILKTEPPYNGGMALDALLFYDDGDFAGNFNPTIIEAETLPVYKNLSYNKYGHPLGMEYGELREKYDGLAEYFGIEGEPEVHYYPKNDFGISEERVVYLSVRTEKCYLMVSADGSWSILFGDEYEEDMPYPTEEENALYCVGKYGRLFDFENPAVYIHSGGRDIYGELSHSEYYVYDKTDDESENLLRRTYSYVRPILYDGVRLGGFHVSGGMEFKEKIGDYPIISHEEAKEKLLSGKFIETATKDYVSEITEDKVVGCTMIYVNSPANEYLMPYYRFFVLLDDTVDVGGVELKRYGAFYIPAVSEEYLSE